MISNRHIANNYRNVGTLFIVSLLFVLFVLSSCNDNTKTGLTILDDADKIMLGTDTIKLSTNILEAEYIPSDPDSLLLGEADSWLGTIHADFISQFTCPEGFVYPENAVLDSAYLTLYYYNWYGDGNSPMQINAYQLDRKTLDYDSVYYTNIDPKEYCTFNVKATDQPRIVTAATPSDSFRVSSSDERHVKLIRIRLTEETMQLLYNKGRYTTQEQFNDAFKGLYLTTSFGSATVLYINSMAITMRYHFTYQLNGRDTTVTDAVDFYSNDEVRCVNRIKHDKRTDYVDLLTYDSTVSYVSSPAHIYTMINIPLAQMAADIKDTMLQGKRPYVNSAELRVYATNYTTNIDIEDITQWAQPPSFMLLIATDYTEQFLTSRSLPNDTIAILSALNAETDSLENVHAYYSFNLSRLLTEALRIEDPIDTLQMVLIPVTTESVTSASSGTTTITSVRPLQTISYTVVNTQFNESYPLRLSVVATGL